jgi:hypothetical protein
MEAIRIEGVANLPLTKLVEQELRKEGLEFEERKNLFGFEREFKIREGREVVNLKVNDDPYIIIE